MPPKQKSKNQVTTGRVRKTRSHSKVHVETTGKRPRKQHVTGGFPSRPCLVDSDSDVDTTISADEAAETLLFCSNQERPRVTPIDSPVHTTEKTQNDIGSGNHSRTRKVDDSMDRDPEIIPPLPSMSVTIADLDKNKLLDPFNRKEVCQHNQSKLEAEFTDFWKPDQEAFSDRFLTEHASDRYSTLRKRTIIEEKVVSSIFPMNRDVVDLIAGAGLSESVENLEPYCKEVVLEFYANFTHLSNRKSGINFIFIRGRMYEFSPRMINLILGTENHPFAAKSELDVTVDDAQLISEITGDQISQWKDFKSIFLLPVLNCLHGVCSLNWLPTSNSTYVSQDRAKLIYKVWKKEQFNFGKLIFDQVAAIVSPPSPGPPDRKKTLPFPYIISKVLEFQKAIPRWPKEMPEHGPKDYRVDIRASKMQAGRKSARSCLSCKSLAAEVRATIKKMSEFVEKMEVGGDMSECESSDNAT